MRKLLIILCIFCIISVINCSFAVDTGGIKNYFAQPKSDVPNTTEVGRNVISVLTYIGYVLAACVISITAIKFIIANPGQKAKLKDKLWLILIGVVILAGGIPLLQLVADIMEKVGKQL